MSVMDHAHTEMTRAKFDPEDQILMLGLLQQFLRQWDSGGAAAEMVRVFNRLISLQPLTPLTGEESEWIDRKEYGGKHPMWQNARCSSVFRVERYGEFVYYDIDADPEVIPPGPDGLQRITFPYDPLTSMVKPPVVEFNLSDGEAP